MTEQFVAGIVGAPFGLKGFVKVKPLSGEIDHLLKLRSVILRQGEKEQSLTIEESAAIPPSVAMRFAGFHDPEATKALRGAELLVSREDAAPLQPGELYVEDLKELAVLAADSGEILGHITTIIEGGGGDLAEIRLQNGTTRLVPFRKEFFTGIDLEKRQVILHNLWILE
ncbi:MAG: ribosome maturation factor RimM [Treponema sp.]|jgi:16S rRNA processing protein RimM|nr:ribosome maturation factor RimM [Treponema sp.]